MPTEIRLSLSEVELYDNPQDYFDLIVYSNLSAEEKEIIQTAPEEGEYTSEIGEQSSALRNLHDRISERTDDDGHIYLKRNDAYYRINYVSGDHIIAY
jgi:hypothetical protein